MRGIHIDILTDMSVKIAEATVPDEIDLAPLITDAFVQGGEKKDSLFGKQESAEIGAFGFFEGLLLFPWILKGISVTSRFILDLLSIDDSHISTVSDFLNIYDKLKGIGKENQLPEKYLVPVSNIFSIFSSELKTSGLPEDQCDRIISNVLVTLLKDPAISVLFVEKVAGTK